MRIEAKLPNGAAQVADLQSILTELAAAHSGFTGNAAADGPGFDIWIDAQNGQQLVAAIEALGPVFATIGSKPASLQMTKSVPETLRQRLGTLTPTVNLLAE